MRQIINPGLVGAPRVTQRQTVVAVVLGPVVRLWGWIARPWLCALKRCAYYRQYLVRGPADLTHMGYHAAERECREVEQRIEHWFDEHGTGVPPRWLVDYARRWEETIRA